MKRATGVRLALLALAVAPMLARAALVTAPESGGSARLGFDAHPTQEITFGPVTLTASDGRDVVFTAVDNFGAAGFSSDIYGLGNNGQWRNVDRSFAWVNGGAGGGADSSMLFTFADGPVSSVGGFMNYVPSSSTNPYYYASDFVLSALGRDGSVLERYALADDAPIVTTATNNAGAYRGIARSSADIYAFEIQGAGVIGYLDLAPLAAVPEPSTGALLLAGLAAFGFAVHRRRA